MKIDIFPHILPKPYFDKMLSLSQNSAYMQKGARDVPVLHDLDTRFRIMEQYEVEDYVQVLTLNLPPIEVVAGPKESPDLAMLEEAQRAIKGLGARGVQILLQRQRAALDEPEFLPLFELVGQLDFPMWMHPTRSPDFADYCTETRSKYDLW